ARAPGGSHRSRKATSSLRMCAAPPTGAAFPLQKPPPTKPLPHNKRPQPVAVVPAPPHLIVRTKRQERPPLRARRRVVCQRGIQWVAQEIPPAGMEPKTQFPVSVLLGLADRPLLRG